MALRDLGFSVLQERLYMLLVHDGASGSAELGRRMNVGESELAHALDGLAELAVIRFGPSGVVVPSPAYALGTLIARLEDELMAQYRRVWEVRSEVAALEAGFAARTVAAPSPDIEEVEGLDAVRERIEELSFFSRVSVDSVQPGGPQSSAAIEASRPLDQRASRRRIAMRLIHEKQVADEPMNRAHLLELRHLGVEVRLVGRPLGRMVIFDRSVAVVPIEPGNSRRGALIVRQDALVAGLVDLFESEWDTAVPLDFDDDPQPGEPRDPQPSDDDRQLLALLASGATDETVAREIGVSPRHLRRRLARIHTMLGTDSRFGAGVEAARRGWL